MVIDERQLEVDVIMDGLPDSIRYDKNATISGITQREQKQWIARNPAPGENRNLIGGTDFKPLAWFSNAIKLIRPKAKRDKRR